MNQKYSKVSVVVATCNRERNLPKLIVEWSKIKFSGELEVIFVDNASTDNTKFILSEGQIAHRSWLRFLYEPKKGVSNARNSGFNASHGDIIIFTDDDCYPREDFIAKTVRTFADSSIAFGGGRVLLYDHSDMPLTLQESNLYRDLPSGSFLASGCIHGANMSFRRSCFEAIGGFDPNLGPGKFFSSGEDTDLMRRALAAGFSGKYDPEMVVYHHHRRKTESARRRLYRSYDRGMGAGFMKMCIRSSKQLQIIKQFYWHLRTMPFLRALRQTGFFVLYGIWRLQDRIKNGSTRDYSSN